MCSTFVPKIDSFENNDKQFIKFIINLNTVIMRIFTKSLLVLVMLCIAGAMSAKKEVVQEGVENLVKSHDYSVAQTNHGWMGGLPEGVTVSVDNQAGYLMIDNPSDEGDNYLIQLLCATGVTYKAGSDYKIVITYTWEVAQGDDTSKDVWFEAFTSWGGRHGQWTTITAGAQDHTATLNWTNLPTSSNPNDGGVMIQCRKAKGVLKIKKVDVYEVNPKTIEYEWVDVNVAEAYKKEYPATDPTKVSMDEEIVVNSPVRNSQDHDTQFWIKAKQTIPAGTVIKLSFEYKASSAQNVGTQCHEKPGNYIHWQALSTGYEDFGTNWKTYDQLFTIPSQCNGQPHMDGENYAGFDNNFQSIAFNLSKEAEVTYYFRNIKIQLDNDDIIDELRPEYRPETAVGVDIEINDTDPAIVAKKVALLSAINRAKDADRTNKTKASMKALDDAVTEGYKMFAPEALKKKVTVQIPGEDEKKNLTFSTAEYCAAQWDATAQTLTWGQGGWNAAWTFMSADGVSGDLSEWTKLHLKVSDFTNSKENKLKVVFQENDGNMPPAGAKAEGELVPDADGNIDLDLAGFNWGSCPKNNIADMTIYGLERTDETAAASVKVTEAWLAKPTYKEEEQTVDKTQAEILTELTAAAQAIRSAIIDLEDRPAPAAEPAVPDGWKSLITNGTLEGEDMSSFFIVEPDGEGLRQAVREDYAGIDDFHAAVVTSKDAPATDWDTQFFIRSNEVLPKGTKIRVEFDYCASIAGGCDTQAHEEPTKYIHWACIGSPNFTDKWQHFTFEGTVPSQCDGSQHKEGDGSYSGYDNNFHAIAFNLAKNKKATTFYFDNIVFLAEDIQTAVKSVEKAEKAGKGEYFDLQGRRVAKPGKGLYILNGRKVAIK